MNPKLVRSASGLLAEVLSVFLPVIVVWLAANQYNFEVGKSPEWAVGAVILFGQACVKFTTSISSVKSSRGPMSLIIVTLVMGIVVSCYLLVRTTEAELSSRVCPQCKPEGSHVQVIWFVVSAIVYMALGLLCDLAIEAPE